MLSVISGSPTRFDWNAVQSICRWFFNRGKAAGQQEDRARLPGNRPNESGVARQDHGRGEDPVWHTIRHQFVLRHFENARDPVTGHRLARHKDGQTTHEFMHARESKMLAQLSDQIEPCGEGAEFEYWVERAPVIVLCVTSLAGTNGGMEWLLSAL
jgi:hypothetical protein